MAKVANLIETVLRRHGVADAEGFLLSKGADAPMKRSSDPDVRARGNIQMMKGLKTTREKVEADLEKLEYL